MKLINIGEKEDKIGWFREQYEQEEYKRIIKNPMYFAKMRNNISEYLVDVNLMKDHFNLIFTNAFNYNKPKDRAYKDAERVQEIVNRLLERKWDKLIEKQDMSIEEQEHQAWVQEQIKIDPTFLDKSEDIEVPHRKFMYFQSRPRKNKEEVRLVRSNRVQTKGGSNTAQSIKEINDSIDQSDIDAASK